MNDGVSARIRTADLLITNRESKFKKINTINVNWKLFQICTHYRHSDYETGKTVVTDGGSYSNNGVSAGFIRLQSPYNPKTHILIGTCYGNPYLLNRVEKYIETIIPIEY